VLAPYVGPTPPCWYGLWPLVLCAGPDLTDAWPCSNMHVRPPLPLFRGKKWKALINLQKSENDALKVLWVKISKSLLECPRSLRLLLPPTQKRLIARICWNPTCLAGTGLLTATGKPTEITTIEKFDKTHGLPFSKNHMFFLICVRENKKQTHCTYSMCGGIKTLKHNVSSTLQIPYHYWKKTHTHEKNASSKTHPHACNC